MTMANDAELNELRIRVQKLESENMLLRQELVKTSDLLDHVVEARNEELNEKEEYVPDPSFRDPAVQ